MLASASRDERASSGNPFPLTQQNTTDQGQYASSDIPGLEMAEATHEVAVG